MKGHIKIDVNLCKGCLYCIEACPSGVIAVKKTFNRAGYFPAYPQFPEKCTGCGMCATVCPDIAITVYRKKEADRHGK
ncbi:MAG: 4Fe-4S binding protein [Nitrospirae bacterium]|nr:4Fe-4S binding protein [Nitrospirota bacterium]